MPGTGHIVPLVKVTGELDPSASAPVIVSAECWLGFRPLRQPAFGAPAFAVKDYDPVIARAHVLLRNRCWIGAFPVHVFARCRDAIGVLDLSRIYRSFFLFLECCSAFFQAWKGRRDHGDRGDYDEYPCHG